MSAANRGEEPAQWVVPVPFGPGLVGTACLGRRKPQRGWRWDIACDGLAEMPQAPIPPLN